MGNEGVPVTGYLLSVMPHFSADTLAELSGIFILILASAAISGSESAFFSLRNNDLIEMQESRHPSQKIVVRLLEKPKQLLATILIINTLINIAVAILAADAMHSIIPGETETDKNLRFVIEIITVTFTLVLLGEVTPKVYAAHYNKKFASVMAYPLLVLNGFFSPLSWLMTRATKLIEKRMDKKGHDLNLEEIRHAIELTSDDKTTIDEKKILKGVINFSNTNVRQIMKPRMDVVAHEINTPYKELLKLINDNQYSRLPVFKENFDHIEGILYIKDLIPYLGAEENFEWQNLLRKPYVVPESKMIDDLLDEFQKQKVHLAIVVDEYGGASGIVTLEDILEEIVGEINDEFDDDEISYSELDENTFIFNGKTSLTDVAKAMNLEADCFDDAKGESETLGGLIIEIAGKIPAISQTIKWNNFTFRIESADRKKIKRAKISVVRQYQQDA